MISLWLDKIRPSHLFKCLLYPLRRLRREFESYLRVNCLILSNLRLKLFDDFLSRNGTS
jgi:hypothetical protein